MDYDVEAEDGAEKFAISQEQLEFVLGGLDQLTTIFETVDGKPRKACLFLFTKESDDGHVSINMVGNLDRTWLQELLAEWLHSQTH